MDWEPKPPFDRPIRAVVADIDGTLTTPDRRLSASAQVAVMRLETVGIPVILASGNVLPGVRTVAYMVGSTGPLVAENGGLILYRGEHWEEVVEPLADISLAEEAYARVKERFPNVRRLITDRWRETEIALEEGPDVDAIKEVVDDLPVRVETTGYAIHLIDARVSKGTGVLRALEVIDVPPEETMAVGDSENDISVFEVCGLAVTVNSSDERVVKAADYATRATDGDGFFEAINQLLGRP